MATQALAILRAEMRCAAAELRCIQARNQSAIKSSPALSRWAAIEAAKAEAFDAEIAALVDQGALEMAVSSPARGVTPAAVRGLAIKAVERLMREMEAPRTARMDGGIVRRQPLDQTLRGAGGSATPRRLAITRSPENG